MASVVEKINGLEFELDDCCPNCDSFDIREDEKRAETFCFDCGAVLEEMKIAEGRGIFIGEDEDGNSKIHDYPTDSSRFDKGLGSEIGNKYEIRYSKWGPYRGKILAKKHRSAKLPKVKIVNQIKGANMINELFAENRLSGKIQRRAVQIFKNASEEGLIKGRALNAVIAASVYASHREVGEVTDFDLLEDKFGVEEREINMSYKILIRETNLVPGDARDLYESSINNMIEEFDIPSDGEKYAFDVYSKIKPHISGRKPGTIAAAITYMTLMEVGMARTQKQVSEAAGVTDVSLRNNRDFILDKIYNS